ncbi:MAG: hypothetical protein ACWA6U_18685, partial [Breznakibacter sp.]
GHLLRNPNSKLEGQCAKLDHKHPKIQSKTNHPTKYTNQWAKLKIQASKQSKRTIKARRYPPQYKQKL